MTTLMIWQNNLLIKNGLLAIGQDCCTCLPTCCPCPVPYCLKGTFSAPGCPNLDGYIFYMIADPDEDPECPNIWNMASEVEVEKCDWEPLLTCDNPGQPNAIYTLEDAGGFIGPVLFSVRCQDPFQLVFTGLADAEACCEGSPEDPAEPVTITLVEAESSSCPTAV